jgi:hypothetical protein
MLNLRDEHRERVFKNRMLRRKSEPQKEKRRMEKITCGGTWTGSTYGDIRNASTFQFESLKGEDLLERIILKGIS